MSHGAAGSATAEHPRDCATTEPRPADADRRPRATTRSLRRTASQHTAQCASRVADRAPQPAASPERTRLDTEGRHGSESLPSRNGPRLAGATALFSTNSWRRRNLQELTRFTLEHEADFQRQRSDFAQRRSGRDQLRAPALSRADGLGEHQDMMLTRIKTVLPQVLERLGMEEFAIADVEAQITASNDGDFFHFHSDNGK